MKEYHDNLLSIQEKKLRLIKRLYDSGFDFSEIASNLNLSRNTAKAYYYAARLDYPTYYKYQKALIIKRGYKSVKDYVDYLAWLKEHNLPKSNASLLEYRRFISKSKKEKEEKARLSSLDKIRLKGYDSFVDYYNYLAKRHGHESYLELRDVRARQQGHSSYSSLVLSERKKRSRRKLNRLFSNLLKSQLEKLAMSQAQLADEIGVSESAIHHYLAGHFLPKEERAAELFSFLGLPYRSLEELLES